MLLSHGVTAPIVLASSLRLGVFRRELIVERGRERERGSVPRRLRVNPRSCRYGMGALSPEFLGSKRVLEVGGLVPVSLLRAYMTGESVHQECLRGVLYFLQLLFFACVIDNYIVRYRLLSSRRGDRKEKSKEEGRGFILGKWPDPSRRSPPFHSRVVVLRRERGAAIMMKHLCTTCAACLALQGRFSS